MTSSANEIQPSSNEPVREGKSLDDGLGSVEERDRQLLACELHDGLLQQVVGAKMMLEAALARVNMDQPLRPGELSTICEHLEAAIVEGRRLLGGLRPAIVAKEGLVPAIELLLRENARLHSATVHFRHDLMQSRYSPALEQTLFRIVQESVANTVRHSHASEVDIELTEEPDRVRLMIRDNGIGFEPANIPQTGFGIQGIKRRARMADGMASIESAPGRGTTIIVELPKEVRPA
jgi:signal transduction histidine kinase